MTEIPSKEEAQTLSDLVENYRQTPVGDAEHCKPEAKDILIAAANEMSDRAKTYDAPDGERSMGATVKAFNAVTGHDLSEEQSWLFMVLLKAVRSQQGNYRTDNYADGAAYFALMGETAARDRKKGETE